MCRKILFSIFILVSFFLLINVGNVPNAEKETILKHPHAIPVNPKPAFSADVIRGDANADGEINAGDIVYLIIYLFRGGPPPLTLEHGDANNDGTIDIVDMIYILHYLFSDGPPPPLS